MEKIKTDWSEKLPMRVQLTILIVVLILGYFFSTLISKQTAKQFVNVKQTQNSEPLIGVVKNRILNKGSVVVEFRNSKRYQIPSCKNENYTSSYINNFIQVGDSLSKVAFSDTLYIYRNKQRYFFVLEKVVRKVNE